MAEAAYVLTADISKGIDALYLYFGEDARSLLRPIAPKGDEIACFEFPLPEDYLGISVIPPFLIESESRKAKALIIV